MSARAWLGLSAALLVACSQSQGTPPWVGVSPSGNCAPDSGALQAFLAADAGRSPIARGCREDGTPVPATARQGQVVMQYVGPPCSAQRDCIEGEVCDGLGPAPELGTRCIPDETKALTCPPGMKILGEESTPGELECFTPPG